ncbi:MAG: hypothetical protein IJ274_11260 [Lachnospiraceae bacterium]|nr:hypothetical protein [Lachnospiraceae bacterium]
MWRTIYAFTRNSWCVAGRIVLGRAMVLCEEKYGQCVWPNSPNDCWEQAYNEIIKGK